MSRCLFAIAALSSLTLACKDGSSAKQPPTGQSDRSVDSPADSPADNPAADHNATATPDRTAPPRKWIPFAQRKPQVGDPAPQLQLPQLDGDPVNLAAAYANGPTVLIFGSYT